MDIRMYGTVDDSIVDGPGLRFSVFVQGCSHHCPGCHNPESQPVDGGFASTTEAICTQIAASSSASGVTLTGGEPFEQPEACLEIARQCKQRGLSVWIYSGYTYEQIAAGHCGQAGRDLLKVCDVLVDGPFCEAQRSLGLMWKGSANQRVIDLAQTAACGRVILYGTETFEFDIPESW